MIRKLLVANRGEIAIRIMRSAQELGIKTVAVYEETDRFALHIMKADEALCIGPGPRKDYLNIDNIIQAALRVGADAIHPGYGFLSENPEFPQKCREAGLIFVGPPSEVIWNMGSKVIAREIMKSVGIPLIPGTDKLPPGREGEEVAIDFARKYGFPIMVKAVSGGGGRGIRVVRNEGELLQGLKLSRSEARLSFGNEDIYLEKGIDRPRHVEVQILADNYGNVIHMGTRNCSIQRRHQKLIEIAPSFLPPLVEERVCDAAVKAAKAAGYVNAGTVEFLVDQDNNFYFLEVNTRIQVEHTVTEMVTGIDIVREQLRIASGEPLSISQDDVSIRGCAIELRINAEDPKQGFLPCPGLIEVYQSPGGHGVRLDGAVYQGYEIPRFYDSLIVKLTVYGFNWEEAVDRLRRALDGFSIVGVKTTIPFYRAIVDESDFRARRFDTTYIETHPQLLDYREEEDEIDKLARLVAEINAHGFNPYTESP
ncbi:acetyl-CoA carboxylase biotin carboxylase subunit [Thermodesulforhabdus norvegica]|uniref:Acetyl-CoA carboxylase, biotin carboxylase subunit n=1 Tax=Thermodesulforhabdus norvegica TaxID=39841 RepID=A0A1I4U9R5_9BACT|nr:acetyl-CoA carboxylase biotin carboxylase subunit [Thermodesulforhabdus norvegica]SFM85712.1 acetyl-CoA carboxylase, biotin carboxylase subunit [Thermodesulforhabdus norvegica]